MGMGREMGGHRGADRKTVKALNDTVAFGALGEGFVDKDAMAARADMGDGRGKKIGMGRSFRDGTWFLLGRKERSSGFREVGGGNRFGLVR
jgi:hypothetical protein